jgi:hypothetical protein
MRKWTDAQLQEWDERLSNGDMTRQEIAAAMQTTEATVKSALQRWRASIKAAPKPDAIELEMQRLARVASLREEKELMQEVANERSLWKKLQAELDRTVPKLRALRPVASRARTDKVVRESLLKLWSDWHAGEKVDPERMRGLNSYNWQEFVQRLATDTDQTLKLSGMMQAGGWQFEEAVVPMIGDLVSGTIHELERHSDTRNIVECVVDTAGVAAVQLQRYAEAFPVVRSYSVSGNHGRLGDARRVQQKDPTRSWDALIALVMQRLLAKQENLSIEVPYAYAVAFDIQGFTFLAQHGHDIKSWNSIPHYGINRYVTSINAIEAARNSAIHYFLLGHFHGPATNTIPSGEFIINGSLIGGTEFGLNALGKVDRPTQWMCGVHHTHGMTHRWPVYCTNPVGR